MIASYSDDEYENFVKEWALEGLGQRYAVVRRASGAGDMGRDVLGFVTPDLDTSSYDNYQCKHYRGSLAPSDIWVEIGKLCWYTYKQEYRVPRAYYFVAPEGIGPTLQRLLENPEKLRTGFLAQWEKHCATGIASGVRIPLNADLLHHINAFDFRIFKSVDPDELIEQHAATRRHAARFGGGLRARPPAEPPPPDVKPNEMRYVRQLLDAYGNHLNTTIEDANSIGDALLVKHFSRQRQRYYRADSLRRFERDALANTENFASLMNEIYDGVVEISEDDHESGYECVRAVTDAASQIHPSSYALVDHLQTADKQGICHHLANEDRLHWCGE